MKASFLLHIRVQVYLCVVTLLLYVHIIHMTRVCITAGAGIGLGTQFQLPGLTF